MPCVGRYNSSSGNRTQTELLDQSAGALSEVEEDGMGLMTGHEKLQMGNISKKSILECVCSSRYCLRGRLLYFTGGAWL